MYRGNDPEIHLDGFCFDRHAQLHKLVQKDKRKNKMTQLTIEENLSKTRTKLEQNKIRLEELIRQRAELAIDGKTTTQLDNQIAVLKSDVANGPAVIELLEERQREVEQAQQQIDRDKLLNTQKRISNKIKKFSKELVAALADANRINNELRNSFDNYFALREQTGVDTLSMKVTDGSHGSLKQLYEIRAGECEGKRGLRPPMSPGMIAV